MTSAVIAAYVRSPFHFAHKGSLAAIRPDDLLAQVIQGLLARTDLPREDIEDVIVGCAFPEAEQGLNIARLAVLLTELPLTVGGTTVNRFCGSSMQAIHMAAGAIHMKAGRVFICAGIESMTRIPMGGYNPMPHPALAEKNIGAYMSMGTTAENLAMQYQITRQDQDGFALSSHQKAHRADSEGKFLDEIIPIRHGGQTIDKDGCIRGDTSLDTLAQLSPAFDQKGSVTAGTSSPLTDGASAVLVCDADYAKAHGLSVLARIRAVAIAGCDPRIMGIGPVAATQKALARASLKIEDLDIIELNEAFAVQALACIRELTLDPDQVNIDGGAIALGHPLGATGARITGKAASLLKRNGRKFALATQCIGGGQGIATLLEAV